MKNGCEVALGVRSALCAAAVTAGLVIELATARAGGLAIREQSASAQGSSFAGSAAGGSLGSAFWNSAALAGAGWGWQSESSYSLIVPNAEVTALPGTFVGPGSHALGEPVDIGNLALVPASYSAYRLSNQLVLGVAINSPFGLSTKADDHNWAGQFHGRTGKTFTLNVNPMLAYSLLPNLAIGVGAQAQYAKLTFKANPALPPLFPGNLVNQGLEVDDIAFGATAGVMWSPAPGTTLGVGYRSAIKHTFEGDAFVVGNALPVIGPFAPFGVKADVTLPEIVTASLRQQLTPNARLLASVEWTNWTRLGVVDFVATSAGGGVGPAAVLPGQVRSRFDFNWHDGWFFALGGEYDWNPGVTLRAGLAYEISPIQNPSERFALITDSDRIWASAGLSYKLSPTSSLDLAYSHVFFHDAGIERTATATFAPLPLLANVEQSADIFSVGLRMTWGAAPAPLK